MILKQKQNVGQNRLIYNNLNTTMATVPAFAGTRSIEVKRNKDSLIKKIKKRTQDDLNTLRKSTVEPKTKKVETNKVKPVKLRETKKGVTRKEVKNNNPALRKAMEEIIKVFTLPKKELSERLGHFFYATNSTNPDFKDWNKIFSEEVLKKDSYNPKKTRLAIKALQLQLKTVDGKLFSDNNTWNKIDGIMGPYTREMFRSYAGKHLIIMKVAKEHLLKNPLPNRYIKNASLLRAFDEYKREGGKFSLKSLQKTLTSNNDKSDQKADKPIDQKKSPSAATKKTAKKRLIPENIKGLNLPTNSTKEFNHILPSITSGARRAIELAKSIRNADKAAFKILVENGKFGRFQGPEHRRLKYDGSNDFQILLASLRNIKGKSIVARAFRKYESNRNPKNLAALGKAIDEKYEKKVLAIKKGISPFAKRAKQLISNYPLPKEASLLKLENKAAAYFYKNIQLEYPIKVFSNLDKGISYPKYRAPKRIKILFNQIFKERPRKTFQLNDEGWNAIKIFLKINEGTLMDMFPTLNGNKISILKEVNHMILKLNTITVYQGLRKIKRDINKEFGR